MRTNRWVVLSTIVLGTALLGACSAGGDGSPDGSEIPETASPTTTAEEDDVVACTGFGDVLTVIENADIALAEGRIAAQEQHGWYDLATRVLDRLPSGADTAVQTAIGAMQEAVLDAPSGTTAESTGVRSPAWSQAEGDLGDACEAVGAPLAIRMFTGG